VITPEDVVAYKLLADRPRDRDDIQEVICTQLRAARRLDWDYVERWALFWGIEERVAKLRAAFDGSA